MIRIFMRDAGKYGVAIEPWNAQQANIMADAPQAQWRSDQCWEMPVTEPNTRFLAVAIAARYSTEVDINADARVYMTHALLSAKALDIKAKRRAEYTFKDTSPVITDYDFGKWPPYKHQIVAFDACRGTDYFALFMDMGTGKTPVSIHRICWELIKLCGGDKTLAASELPEPADASAAAVQDRREHMYRVLVIAPKNVLTNWGRELEKHCTLPFSFGAMRGQANDRLDTITLVMQSRKRLKIVAINYDALRKYKGILLACQFHLVIADESTRLKNTAAKRTSAAIEISEGLPSNGSSFDGHTPKKMILTGQPITKNVIDIYAQAQFLDPFNAPLGYTTKAKFAQRYTEKDPYSQKIIPRNVEELKEKVARFAFIVKKHECLDLPEKTYVVEDIFMEDAQKQFYKDFRDKLIAEIMSELDSVKGMAKATNILVKFLRLAQITSGFIPYIPHDEQGFVEEPFKNFQEIKEFTPNPKLVRCCELVDEIVDPSDKRGQKVIVWARFRHDIKAIERELAAQATPCVVFSGDTKDWERDMAVRNFNENDDMRVFVGQPQSGGLGLTLIGSASCPVSSEIFYSNDFNLESRIQAEDRAHRIGMHVPLTIYDLVVPNTIDRVMLSRLIEKKDFADGFTDAKSMALSLLSGDGGENGHY